MISYANAKGLVKIRLACLRVFLLIILFSNIVTYSNGCMKGDKSFLQSKRGKSAHEIKLFIK